MRRACWVSGRDVYAGIGLGAIGATSLVDSLLSLPRLTSLNLESTHIHSQYWAREGWEGAARTLHAANRLSTVAASSLAKALLPLTQLTSLNLGTFPHGSMGL
jgi:hypothetical protein